MNSQQRAIATAMLKHTPKPVPPERVRSPTFHTWKGVPEPVAKLLTNDPFTVFVGATVDRGIEWERAWYLPYEVRRRLGHLDVRKITKMSPAALAA